MPEAVGRSHQLVVTGNQAQGILIPANQTSEKLM